MPSTRTSRSGDGRQAGGATAASTRSSASAGGTSSTRSSTATGGTTSTRSSSPATPVGGSTTTSTRSSRVAAPPTLTKQAASTSNKTFTDMQMMPPPPTPRIREKRDEGTTPRLPPPRTVRFDVPGKRRAEEDIEDDDDQPRTSSSSQDGSSTQSSGDVRSNVTLTVDEMVHNCVCHFFVSNYKKVPIKRSDLLKHAMNGQKKQFKEVMDKLEFVINDVFGFNIVGLDQGKQGFASYIPVSNYTFQTSNSVTVQTREQEAKRGLLFLILSVAFMQVRPLDEEQIWRLITELQFKERICPKRDDLQKFLKSEYVVPMYLTMEETKDADCIIHRYSWGPRADVEFSKWEILKFVAEQHADARPEDFDNQFNVVKQTETEKVESDLRARMNPPMDREAARNGSALKITEGPGGTSSYSIESGGAAGPPFAKPGPSVSFSERVKMSIAATAKKAAESGKSPETEEIETDSD